MNDPTFVIGLVFHLVMLALIPCWFGYQTVRMIKALQKVRADRQQTRANVAPRGSRFQDSLGKVG